MSIVVLDSGKFKIVQGIETEFRDTHQIDAFGRLRVSNPSNIFEYTHKYDVDFDVYWSTETSIGGTVTYDSDKVSRFLNVTSTTGSKAIIQTRRRMEYYAGKSHLWHWSVNLRGAVSGVRKRVGAFDNENGFFFEADGTTINLVIRSKVTGLVVDKKISQPNWNGDKLDGTGESGHTIDLTKGSLFWVDFSWLGMGAVSFGILYKNKFITLHTETISQEEADPYTQSPHLPFRMEIENTGGGIASEVSMVCVAYEVEGNAGRIGKSRSWFTDNPIEGFTNEEVVAVFRINPNYKYSSAKFEKIKAIIGGSDEMVFRIYQNPTITSGAITWGDIDNSIIQPSLDISNDTIDTSSGNMVFIDQIRDDGDLDLEFSDVFFGFDVNSTPDLFVITAEPLDGSSDVIMSAIFKEFY